MGIIWFCNFKGLLNPWYMFIENTMSLVKYLCLESWILSWFFFFFFFAKRKTALWCNFDRQFLSLVAVVSLTKSSIYCLAFSLEIEMEVSTMDIPLSRVKELPWRISTRQGFQKLMVRWLLFLVFSMVRPRFLLPIHGTILFFWVSYIRRKFMAGSALFFLLDLLPF